MKFPKPKTLATLFPTLLLALFATLGLGVAHGDDGESVRAGSAVTFLQINDVYSAVPVDNGKAGGLARVAALKKQLAAAGKTPVLVLAGDFLSPSVASTVFKGQQMVDALNAAGLDLATLGNHEFDFGPDVLRQRMREAKWQWVVSNVTDEKTGKPLEGAAPYVIRKYGPLTVGYLGLLLPGSEISPDRRQGIRIEDPFAAAARLLPVLKQKGADTIVALTHLDYADDRRLAQRFPQIDVIIGGHDHFPITSVVDRTLISKAGSDARFVARIDLNRAKRRDDLERHHELVPITPALPEEPETARIAADYEARLSKEMDQVVATTRTPLDGIEEKVRSSETNLGNLMADAMRADVEADVALLNSGSIRGNRVYPAGKLTRRDLVAMHPFGGVIAKVEVTGAVLLEALNHGVGRLPEALGRFPQVSGLTFRIDASAPTGQRVRDVRVQGKPLESGRTYTVATNDYLLEGGDGYQMLAKARVLVSPEQGNMLVAGLENYLRSRKEVAPDVEGRIVIDRK